MVCLRWRCRGTLRECLSAPPSTTLRFLGSYQPPQAPPVSQNHQHKKLGVGSAISPPCAVPSTGLDCLATLPGYERCRGQARVPPIRLLACSCSSRTHRRLIDRGDDVWQDLSGTALPEISSDDRDSLVRREIMSYVKRPSRSALHQYSFSTSSCSGTVDHTDSLSSW